MNAVFAVESEMVFEDRLGRVESDVVEIKSDLKSLTARFNESVAANAREFGAVRTEMEKGFGALRADMEKGLGGLRVDMEKGFGALRAEMKEQGGRLDAAIVSAKLWMVITGAGVLVSLIGILGRIFKVF